MSARLAYWSSFLRFRLLIFKSNSKSNSYKNSSNMLPTVSKTRSSISISRPNAMFPQYLRRIVKWQQMDIEYTFWQMLHLCTAPKIAFLTNAYLREEAPNTCVVEQRVEWQVWLYAFDVHCNSFFPMFVMLYGNFTVNDPFGSFMHNFNTETDRILPSLPQLLRL
ncbi:hypothetical protein GOBAR_DD23146 [Gossypium barbadense]|nr:hypothetical protein GOBAR_DD23146 [Gossypium barbadense]